MKTCTKCGDPKPDDRFRTRTKGKYTWIFGKCMDCEAKEQRARNEIKKQDTKQKQIWRERAKAYRNKNKEEYNAKQREKKKDPKHKEYMRKYRKENAEKIAADHKIVARRFHEHNRDNLTDTYITNKLTNDKKHPFPKHLITPEMIEVKRLQIQILRATGKAKNRKPKV